MKTLLSAIVLLLVYTSVYAQSPLAVGSSQINVGIGLSEWGIPIYLGIDHSVHRDFTLGAEVSFRFYRENWENGYYNQNIIGISGNGNYHFNTLLKIPQNFDLYAGLNIGFYIWSSPAGYRGSHSSGLDIGAQIGGRYYFTNTVGVNLELGGGNAFSGGKVGLSIKL